MSNKLRKDGRFMKCPNRIPLIVGGVLGVVALLLCLFVPKDEAQEPNVYASAPSSGIHLQVPTEPSDDIPDIVIPDDNDPADPTGPAGENSVIVEKNDSQEEIKVIPDDGDVLPADRVTDIGKSENEEQDVEQGETRNDAVLEEKEEAVQQQPSTGENEVITGKEETSTGAGKGDIHDNGDKPNPNGDSNKNAPTYQPSIGGENPFDDGTETDIADTPVEELIGNGENRPGEGIHF